MVRVGFLSGSLMNGAASATNRFGTSGLVEAVESRGFRIPTHANRAEFVI